MSGIIRLFTVAWFFMIYANVVKTLQILDSLMSVSVWTRRNSDEILPVRAQNKHSNGRKYMWWHRMEFEKHYLLLFRFEIRRLDIAHSYLNKFLLLNKIRKISLWNVNCKYVTEHILSWLWNKICAWETPWRMFDFAFGSHHALGLEDNFNGCGCMFIWQMVTKSASQILPMKLFWFAYYSINT